METFSALLALCAGNSPVTGEFPSQRPVTRSFDVFFDLRPNKGLSKQSWGWWFETPSRPLWRHCNVTGLSKFNPHSITGLNECRYNYVWMTYCWMHLRATVPYVTELTGTGGQSYGAVMFSLYTQTTSHITSRVAGDSRRHEARVTSLSISTFSFPGECQPTSHRLKVIDMNMYISRDALHDVIYHPCSKNV